MRYLGFPSPFTVLKCCPYSTVLDLYGVTSSLWEECYGITAAERFDGTTEKGLTIVALANHGYISRTDENFTEDGIHKEARWIGPSECCHGRNAEVEPLLQ